MRGSILGSGLLHLLALVAVTILRPSSSYVVPGPDVVQVALVDPSPAPVTAAPEVKPPEPKPEPKPEIKPAEESGVKLEPAPARPRKPEKKVEEAPPAPSRAATPALPGARVGTSGLRGDLAVDAGNFEFTYYLVLVRNMVAANWAPPAGLSTAGNPVRAVVYFRVGRGGDIMGARIEATSGIEFFDRSALRAVSLSHPLPPLPLGFPGAELGVHFGFEWESP